MTQVVHEMPKDTEKVFVVGDYVIGNETKAECIVSLDHKKRLTVTYLNSGITNLLNFPRDYTHVPKGTKITITTE